MNTYKILIKRNVKLFFKDKGMFITSLITPMILLVLYGTFLGKIYRESFLSAFPKGLGVSKDIINGLVGGQLLSSILAVSCVTVAFCSNFLMVQDKASSRIKDLTISPVKSSVLSVSYYIATLFSTLIICFAALLLCLGYVYFEGWYLSAKDVVLLFTDVLLLVLFGTALSSLINLFLSTQGQISAVGTIISSCYGFISGAYMPIANFNKGLQKVLSFLPGTYGTSLLRNHATRGAIAQLVKSGVPKEIATEIKNSLDCNVKFFGSIVKIPTMYCILAFAVIIIMAIYILLNAVKSKKN